MSDAAANCEAGRDAGRDAFVRRIRIVYSVTAAVFFAAVVPAAAWHLLRASLAERRTAQLLLRAETDEQLEHILQTAPVRLPDDRMAEVCTRCALQAFERKDYAESRKLLTRILNSRCHPDFRAAARLELANTLFLEKRIPEGLRELDRLLAMPDLPADCRGRAVELQQYFLRRP